MAHTTSAAHHGIPARGKLDWTPTIAIGALHLGCLLAPFTFTWSGFGVFVIMVWVGAGLGITLCYHRLLTHRSFKTPKWMEYLLTIIGTLNWQGSAVNWVGAHRIHHAESDGDLDPHTPRHGFTWAHVLWTLYRDPPGMDRKEAAKDLMRDPFHRLLHRFFYVPQFVTAAMIYAGGYIVGGHAVALSWFIWGTCVRTVVVWHGTWFVNSAAHTWGYRNFETTDDSQNNWWVALLSFGEGWHNNHHAQQRCAAHGRRWFEFDMTYRTIKIMEMVGLASHVVEPTPVREPKPAEPAAAAPSLPPIGGVSPTQV